MERGRGSESARQAQMDAILQARAIPMPQKRCAVLAGIAPGTMYRWLRQGAQIAVEHGALDESVLEGGADIEIPAHESGRKQVEHFAIEWYEIERFAEAGLVRQIRKCADGYVVEEQETERVWVPTKGKKRGRWVNAKQRTKTKHIAGDWRAAEKLLTIDHEEYRTSDSVSITLREEIGQLTDDEIMAELKGEQQGGEADV